jgi:hypothetical protein
MIQASVKTFLELVLVLEQFTIAAHKSIRTFDKTLKYIPFAFNVVTCAAVRVMQSFLTLVLVNALTSAPSLPMTPV